MLEIIEKLLILQDRDKQLFRGDAELESIEPEKQRALTKCNATQAALEAARQRTREIESRRKDLELQIQSINERIDKYSNQQLQTKKNEEYQALTNEINGCKAKISDLETELLELMDEAEEATEAVKTAEAEAGDVKELEEERDRLAGEIDDRILASYERVQGLRGENVVVGISHSACGGCHMKLTAQVVVTAKSGKELATCPHCSRILYYTRDMDMTAAADAGPGNAF
jgi:predicted  nucleic acid-binding Zn-ribbon protein